MKKKKKITKQIKESIIHLLGGITKEEMPVPLSLPVIVKMPEEITAKQILDKRAANESLDFFKDRLAVQIAMAMRKEGYIHYTLEGEENIKPILRAECTLRATAKVIKPDESNAI